MDVDPRLKLAVDRGPGKATLRFEAAADFEAAEAMTLLARAPFVELCDAVGAGTEERAAFADRDSRLFLSNGWQSWSFGGEIEGSDRIGRTRFVRGLAAQVAHPVRREARGEVLSHFAAWVRSGDHRLLAFSRNSADRALPPISFAFSRRDLSLSIEAYAESARFEKGDTLAEIDLVLADSFFAARDALRGAFARYGSFERLGFLGSGGDLVPGGYESWYNHYADIDDAVISRDIEAISSNRNLINELYLSRGKPTVFQIDDGWERAVGDWAVDQAKFPRGMAVLAAEIEARGMIPGIWIAPLVLERKSVAFRERSDWILRDERGKPVVAGWNPGWGNDYYCYDLSIPEVEEYLAGVFDTLVEEWGFCYLKLDFLYAGMLRGRPRFGGAVYENYDRVLGRLTGKLKNLRGRALAYLGCGAPLEGSFRHMPLMRIGADTKEAWEWPALRAIRHQGRPSAYNSLCDTIGRSFLDKAVFVNDPDVVFCRTRRMSLSEREKELVALIDMLLASQIMFSDDAREFGGAEEAAFTARIVSLHDELSGREYGAERVGRDVFRIFSRDGAIFGIANLSERPWSEPLGRWEPSSALLLRARPAAGALAFEPRSISLFRAG